MVRFVSRNSQEALINRIIFWSSSLLAHRNPTSICILFIYPAMWLKVKDLLSANKDILSSICIHLWNTAKLIMMYGLYMSLNSVFK